MIKNIFCCLIFISLLSSFTVKKNDSFANWKIQINDKLITAENIKLELLSKNTVFKIEYISDNELVSNRFIEVVNKDGVVLKKYSFLEKQTNQAMYFNAEAFYDKLGVDEKLSIYYSEKGKKAKTDKIKLVEITF